jgi:hypothetical protein
LKCRAREDAPHVEEDPGLVDELEHHDVVQLEVLVEVLDVKRHALQHLHRLPDRLLVVQPRLAPTLRKSISRLVDGWMEWMDGWMDGWALEEDVR